MNTFDTPEAEIASLKERLNSLRAEKDEALELVSEMREHLQETNDMLDGWIDVFEMSLNDRGVWVFDRQSKLFTEYDTLLTEHRKLIVEWNQFVPRYNATVEPKDSGRPLAASKAQIAKVKELRKAGHSLRAAAKETGLSLRTVRTILDNAAGKGRRADRASELRRKELGRMRAAAFRAKKRKFEALPKEINHLLKSSATLDKAARGLATK